jgi:hypothetical protein
MDTNSKIQIVHCSYNSEPDTQKHLLSLKARGQDTNPVHLKMANTRHTVRGSLSPHPNRQSLAAAMCMAELHTIYFSIKHKISENIRSL